VHVAAVRGKDLDADKNRPINGEPLGELQQDGGLLRSEQAEPGSDANRRPNRVVQGGEILPQNISRVVAWLLLLAIVVLSLVPPSLRPTTAPHQIEHAAIFLATGISFGFAYLGREWLLSVGAIIFCAVIEIAQLYVPGRHARLSDFVVDATAAVLGVVAGRILLRTWFIFR
jgi:VanZ family protein